MFDSPVTRVCSVRVNEVEACLAFEWLRGIGVADLGTMSKLMRACVAIVAAQARNSGVAERQHVEARERLNMAFGTVGTQLNRDSFGHTVMQEMKLDAGVVRQLQQPSYVAQQQVERQQMWWEQLGCCSAEEGMEFTTWLRENGLTVMECSYVQWKQHVNGTKPFPLLERDLALEEQKRVMRELTQEYLYGQSNAGELATTPECDAKS